MAIALDPETEQIKQSLLKQAPQQSAGSDPDLAAIKQRLLSEQPAPVTSPSEPIATRNPKTKALIDTAMQGPRQTLSDPRGGLFVQERLPTDTNPRPPAITMESARAIMAGPRRQEEQLPSAVTSLPRGAGLSATGKGLLAAEAGAENVGRGIISLVGRAASNLLPKNMIPEHPGALPKSPLIGKKPLPDVAGAEISAGAGRLAAELPLAAIGAGPGAAIGHALPVVGKYAITPKLMSAMGAFATQSGLSTAIDGGDATAVAKSMASAIPMAVLFELAPLAKFISSRGKTMAVGKIKDWITTTLGVAGYEAAKAGTIKDPNVAYNTLFAAAFKAVGLVDPKASRVARETKARELADALSTPEVVKVIEERVVPKPEAQVPGASVQKTPLDAAAEAEVSRAIETTKPKPEPVPASVAETPAERPVDLTEAKPAPVEPTKQTVPEVWNGEGDPWGETPAEPAKPISLTRKIGKAVRKQTAKQEPEQPAVPVDLTAPKAKPKTSAKKHVPSESPQLTKAQAHSAYQIYMAAERIQSLAEKDKTHFSISRKRDVENTWATVRRHAGKLGIDIPNVGTRYDSETYRVAVESVKQKLPEWNAVWNSVKEKRYQISAPKSVAEEPAQVDLTTGKPIEEPARAAEVFPGSAATTGEIKYLNAGLPVPGLAARPESVVSFPEARAVADHISTKPTRALPTIRGTINSVVDKLFDRTDPIRRLVRETVGKPENVTEDMWKMVRMYPGWGGKAVHALDHGTIDYTTNEINGIGLRQILEPVTSKRQEMDLSTYLTAKRALELESYGKETGIAPEDAQRVAEKYEAEMPHIAQAAKEIYAFQDRMLQYLVDSGACSPELAAKLREMYSSYVPFYRLMVPEAVGGAGKQQKLVDIFNPVKRLIGSRRNVIDPLESIIKNVFTLTNIAEKGRISQMVSGLADLPSTVSGTPLVQKLKVPVVGIDHNVQDVQRVLNKAGYELDPAGADEFVTLFSTKMFTPKLGVITVLKDGKRQYFRVEEDVYQVLEGLDIKDMPAILNVLGTPARLLRAGATLNPEFWLGKNPLRDAVQSLVFGKHQILPAQNFFRGLWHMGLNFSGERSARYWEYIRSGGVHSAMVSLDRNVIRRQLRDFIKTGGMERIGHTIKHPIQALQTLSEWTENATRLGEFVGDVNAAEKAGVGKAEALARGGWEARRVTQDFAQMGNMVRPLNRFAAFFGARIGGYTRLVEALSGPRAATTALKIAAWITAPSIGLMLHNRKDPRWAEIPQWQKDMFWIVSTGSVSQEQWDGMSVAEKAQFEADHPVFRIPKPFELGTLFGSLPERFVDGYLNYVDTGDGQIAKRMADTFSRVDVPNPIPTAVMPMLQNYANKNWQGRPVVPESEKGLLPEFQQGQFTSEVAKIIGQYAGYSPRKIDNLMYGYTAGLGRYAVAGVDKLLEQASVVPKSAPEPTKTLADIPFTRGFTIRQPSADSQSVSDFYELYDQASRAALSLRDLQKRGNNKDLMDFVAKHKQEILLAPSLGEGAKALSGLRTRIEQIRQSETLTPEQKRVLIDQASVQMNEIAKTYIQAIQKQK